MRILRVTLGVVLLGGAASAQKALDCSLCHADQAKQLADSAHLGMACSSCHEGCTRNPHPAGLPLPQCKHCHKTEVERLHAGVHGEASAAGNAMAPDCAVCHGPAHTLSRTGTAAFRRSIPDLFDGRSLE